VALNDAECQKCRGELDKLKAEYGGACEVPEVKARLGEVEAALERECSGSSNSDAGAGAVVVGLALGLGLLAAFLVAVSGSRQ